MICFVDIETTGLNPRNGDILEIGAVMVGNNYEIVGPQFSEVVEPYVGHESFPVWATNLDPFITKMHAKSGLLVDIEIGKGLPIRKVENRFLAWLDDFKLAEPSPMGGSSVHFDRAWLNLHAPRIEERFHHRNLDVSSIAIFASSSYPEVYAKQPEGRKIHRALPDLHDTLAQLRYYKEALRAV